MTRRPHLHAFSRHCRRCRAARGAGGAADAGMALIVALLASLVLSALGLMLLMVTSTETLIAGNYRDGVEALHAADGALERVIADVAPLTDWSTALASPDGVVSAIRSTFGDAALSAEMLDGRNAGSGEDDEPAELSASVSAVLHRVQRRTDGPRIRRSPVGKQQPAMAAVRPWLAHSAGAWYRLAVLHRGVGVGRSRGNGRRPGPGWDCRRQSGCGSSPAPRRGVWTWRRTPGSRSDDRARRGGRARHLVAPRPVSTRVRHGDQRLDRQSPGGQGRRTVPRLALAEGQGGYKRSGIVLLLWLALPAWGGLVLAAQSLADVARAEAERRKTIVRPSRVYTNKDLKPAPRAEATAPVSESDAPPSPSFGVPADGHSLTTPDTPRPAGSRRHGRREPARGR